MNSKFLAGVKIKERKKGPTTKKAILGDDELDAYSEKKINRNTKSFSIKRKTANNKKFMHFFIYSFYFSNRFFFNKYINK